MSSTPPATMGVGETGNGAQKPCSTSNRRPITRRPQRKEIDLRVPVTLKNRLAPADSAFLVSEWEKMLRHVMFARGQLPVPYEQLVQILEEREKRERQAKEGRGKGAVVAGGEQEQGEGRRSTRKRRKTRPASVKASAHRRAQKALSALGEVTERLEEAFVRASAGGQLVAEAMILMGASHLSPREIYSIKFLPDPDETDGDRGNGQASLPTAGQGDCRQGHPRSSQAVAYSRKLVRSLVGGTSGVTLPALATCRVHVLLRVGCPRREVAKSGAYAQRNGVGAGAPGGIAGQPETLANAESMIERDLLSRPQRQDLPRHPSQGLGIPPDTTLSTHLSGNGLPQPVASCSQSPCSPVSEQPPLGSPGLPYLLPQPGFKVRVSRVRPAPKVSVIVSTPRGFERMRCSSKLDEDEVGELKDLPAMEAVERARSEGADTLDIPRSGRRGRDNEGSEREGDATWYRLVCTRILGLRGCDSFVD